MTTRLIAKPFLVGAAATTLVSCIAGYIWFEQHRPAVLEVYVFALKSGRSMLIRTPDDHRILVDGGGSSEVIQRLTDIIPFYSRRIDAVIVTNTEGKNASGLIDVIERYAVDRIYVPTYTLVGLGVASSTDRIYDTLLKTAEEKKISIEQIGVGDVVSLEKDVSAHILFPESPDRFEYSRASAPEILFTISYKNTSVLFLGDASKKIQKYVASSSATVIAGADTLIVSHSAAPANMSVELMGLVQPQHIIYKKTETGVVSKKKVGNDPLAGVLKDHRFNSKDGSIVIVSDGDNIDIKKAP